MKDLVKIGIIICDRYRQCAGGKCFRAMQNREGAFERYKDKDVELAGYTTCDGCPGGNIEYAGEEMVKNGVSIIHLATGFLVGYPPCPSINEFKSFMEQRYNVEVVIGTHPIPQKYFDLHTELKTWDGKAWPTLISETLCDQETRLAYD